MTPLLCLATAIYFEARGEPTEGQYAVATVVMNRVEDHRYPDTVCEVVFESKQFSFTHDGKSDKLPVNNAAKKSKEVAEDVLNNVKYPTTATHYHTVESDPKWNKSFKKDFTIGRHVFYTNDTKWR